MKTCLTLLDTEADTEADVAFACQAHAQELHLAASGLKWFNGLTLIGLASLMSGSSVSKRQIRRKRPKPDRAWAAETRELHGTTWNYMETHGNTWKHMETNGNYGIQCHFQHLCRRHCCESCEQSHRWHRCLSSFPFVKFAICQSNKETTRNTWTWNDLEWLGYLWDNCQRNGTNG